MSKQPPPQPASRRRFLQRTLSLIPLAALGSRALPTSAQASEPVAEAVSDGYLPQFFNDEEWRFVLAATDRLIPADALGPGAVSEGVPEFIDRQMELPYGYGQLWYMQPPFATAVPELGYQSSLVPRECWRRGIRAVNGWCQTQFGQPFADLSQAQQEQVLTQLERDDLTFAGLPGALFFTQMLENTREGWLADPLHGGNRTLASWRLIGFPGARADYQQVMDNPGQPYPLGPVSISGKRSA
ncbi:gluconate 2-dehydrogenase subunit 3 family protein [Pantoea sp. 1.19]|uniref:gluconate 2-dehydrogenase subunit 3 family protein n=1 Tax=Pantoea sp. 1.19 TaxID=1925589 RepID=UPI000948F7E7|nr:gluconate 2-dehydrogenase subunit 3 family protein [Pantoea sp. 1.19]